MIRTLLLAGVLVAASALLTSALREAAPATPAPAPSLPWVGSVHLSQGYPPGQPVGNVSLPFLICDLQSDGSRATGTLTVARESRFYRATFPVDAVEFDALARGLAARGVPQLCDNGPAGHACLSVRGRAEGEPPRAAQPGAPREPYPFLMSRRWLTPRIADLRAFRDTPAAVRVPLEAEVSWRGMQVQVLRWPE